MKQKHLIDERKDLRTAPIPRANHPSYHSPIPIDDECCRNSANFKKVKRFTCRVKQNGNAISMCFGKFLYWLPAVIVEADR